MYATQEGSHLNLNRSTLYHHRLNVAQMSQSFVSHTSAAHIHTPNSPTIRRKGYDGTHLLLWLQNHRRWGFVNTSMQREGFVARGYLVSTSNTDKFALK